MARPVQLTAGLGLAMIASIASTDDCSGNGNALKAAVPCSSLDQLPKHLNPSPTSDQMYSNSIIGLVSKCPPYFGLEPRS